MIMKGDVKGAFRHLRIHANHVQWMGAQLPNQDVVVLDLSAPFGWTGSPLYYGAFGGAISWLLSRESPASISSSSLDSTPFFSYEWVDDHILVETNDEVRLFWAEETLRLSMLAILGPNAMNEKKFTANAHALGLDWDTVASTVSMPEDKIQKALDRVNKMREQAKVTRTQLMRLLGSLRHVCTCIRPAKPFYQRLQLLCNSCPSRGTIVLTSGARADLQWFRTILLHGRLTGVPLEIFADQPTIDVHIYMDASDKGLAVLDPARKRFIQLEFTEEENTMIQAGTLSINVREQYAAVLAGIQFGEAWSHSSNSPLTVIACWIDNTSAVAWVNFLSSPDPFSQELNRALGLTEAILGIRLSARHLPGARNVMADAASRAWSPPYSTIWTNFSTAWSQVEVPFALRSLYKDSSLLFNETRWPRRATSSTTPHGANGPAGANPSTIQNGYLNLQPHTLLSWLSSPFTSGSAAEEVSAIPPFCPLLAISHGIISVISVLQLDYTKDIKSLCEGCGGCRLLLNQKLQQPFHSCTNYVVPSTATAPTTAFSGGLRSWAFSFFSEAANTWPEVGHQTATPSQEKT